MSDNGRFWIIVNNRKFLVEPIGAQRPADWGSVNPITGKLENKKGFAKHIGAIDASESIINEENGFINIEYVSGSPMAAIEKIVAG